jgi:HD-like signal output (HDOD) protein
MPRVASPRALLDAVERFPALVAARDRLHECAAADGRISELVAVVESDVALAIAVLRLANHGPHRGSVASVTEAVRVAGQARLRALAARIPTADPLTHEPRESSRQHFRLHSITVQATMERLAIAAGHDEERDELLTARYCMTSASWC